MATAGLTEVTGQIGTTQSALDSMFDQVLQEAKQFQENLKEIENASGESFKDYTKNAGKAYEQTKNLVEYQGKLIEQYKNKLGISRETLKKLEELSGKFSNIATNATNAAKAALKLFNQKYTAKIDVTGFTSAIDALIKKLGQYTKKVGEINYKIVVVDEVSMAPKTLIDLLFKHNCYVICLGDPFQLPPIDKKEDNALLHLKNLIFF